MSSLQYVPRCFNKATNALCKLGYAFEIFNAFVLYNNPLSFVGEVVNSDKLM